MVIDCFTSVKIGAEIGVTIKLKIEVKSENWIGVKIGVEIGVKIWITVNDILTLSWEVGNPSYTKNAGFFDIVQNAFYPRLPPLAFDIYVANFFEGLFKNWVNVCCDKIWQSNA